MLAGQNGRIAVHQPRLAMFALVLCCALLSEKNSVALDFIDPDGDGTIMDADFASGCKAMAALNKSKKKQDQETLASLDQDGDSMLSDEEILQLAADARRAEDFT